MAPGFFKNLCTSGRRVHRRGIKISLKKRDLWDVLKQDGSTRNWTASGTDKHKNVRKEIGDLSFINLHTTKLLEEEEEAPKEEKNI